jgi:hypothetical protein
MGRGFMSLRAIGFHESVSVNKLEELFKSEWHQLFAATTVAHCKKCGTAYAVFLAKSDDPQNGPYIAELGNHRQDSGLELRPLFAESNVEFGCHKVLCLRR